MEYNILIIFIKEHVNIEEKLQDMLSQFGCIIRTRLGLNKDNGKGSIIIADLHGEQLQIDLLLKKLNSLQEIEYKYVKL